MKRTAQDYAKILFVQTKEAQEKDVTKIIAGFLKFLRVHKQMFLLASIIKRYETLLLTHDLLPEITVKSTAPLTGDLKKLIRKQCGASQETHMRETLDEKLVGGLQIKYNSDFYDFSLKRKLGQLQKHFLAQK